MFFVFGGNSGDKNIEVLQLNSGNSFNITEYDSLNSYYAYPLVFKVAADEYLN